ncbi:MAG: hypothetical protein ACYCZY_02730 [Lacisediminihabitans sp.]
MFLNLRIALRQQERGAALVSVVALVAVTVVVGAAVTASVLGANSISTSTRAAVQSRAAADAGIDVAFAQIAGGNYLCATANSSSVPSYSATVVYKDAGGSPLACSGSQVIGSPASAVIKSVGQASNGGTATSSFNSGTVMADVNITPGASSGTLNNAVFSESGFTLTNNTELIGTTSSANDANTYSNGTIICSTQVTDQGTMYAQGDISLQNSCTTARSVWAGGNVTFSSQAVANGDVYAAGTGLMDLNTGHVAGSVIANGSITMSNNGTNKTCAGVSVPWSVCGSVVSLGGTVTASQGASIGGSTYAKGDVTVSNQNGATAIGGDVVSIDGNLANASNASQAGRVLGSVKVGGTIQGPSTMISDVEDSCQATASSTYKTCEDTLTFPAPRPAITLPSALGYPVTATVNKPPRQQMPQINSASSDIANWSGAGWTPVIFDSTTAAAAGKTSCQ